MPLGVINSSTYLKKDNSLRKRSKCVKITRYVEQTLGKKSTVFRRAPCAKMYTWEVHEGRVPCMAGFEGAQSPTPIVLLVWLLRGHSLHQFVSLGGSPRTAAPQLCTLCEHAVLANLVNPIKLGGSARLRGRCPQVGGADHGLEYL